jgi:hypothetical protein
MSLIYIKFREMDANNANEFEVYMMMGKRIVVEVVSRVRMIVSILHCIQLFVFSTVSIYVIRGEYGRKENNVFRILNLTRLVEEVKFGYIG